MNAKLKACLKHTLLHKYRHSLLHRGTILEVNVKHLIFYYWCRHGNGFGNVCKGV